jgi:N-acyl-D-aspartate/D-glutamate deacylase
MVLGEVPEMTWQSFAEYMDVVAQADLGINVACMVPHGAVRHAVMGMDRRAPAEDELDAMREHVDNGMAAGAVGFSTGLIYPPGAFAETDEIVACAEEAARHGAVYVSHIRNEAEGLMEAVAEAIEIGERAGIAVQVSHHKASAPEVWGKTTESIALIEAARARGVDVTFDAYPYTAGSTVLAAARQIRRAVDPDAVMVASTQTHHEYEGKTLAQIGEMVGVSDSGEILNRVLSEEPGAVAIFFTMHEDDVRRVLSHELCMIGSDGIPTPDGKPHPRLYGTFPRVLEYARNERLFSLEEAVRKMTSLPADRFKLTGRGRLVEGAHADIVVFNADTVADVATYQEPRQYPAGIEYVLVNGRVAAEGGAQTTRSAGRLLRRGKA